MQHLELAGWRNAGQAIRKNLKSLGLQGVTDEKRSRLVKLDVARGFTAAQDIVVHAGQVIMHQRIGVNQFDGNGRGIDDVGGDFKKRGRGMA